MPDDTATKPSRLKLAFLSLLGACTVLFVVWTALYIRQIDALQLRTQSLEIEVQALQQRRTVEAEANAKRLDMLEQALFGDVLAKIKPPPQVVNIPKWMEDRVSVLQERITVLERWRMRIGGDGVMTCHE